MRNGWERLQMRSLGEVSAVQLGLAVGPSGWALGGGEYDPAGISEYVLSDDGTGAQRRWRVRVPLELDADGFLVAGAPLVEEIG